LTASSQRRPEDADHQALETARTLINKRGSAAAKAYAGRRTDHLRSIGDIDGADFWERVAQAIAV
jgi:hypothetical protein